MREQFFSFDWASTSLGPRQHWPPELATAVNIALSIPTPMAIFWGHDLLLLYNDAWRALLGNNHSCALGQPANDVFVEHWDAVGPMVADAMSGRETAEPAEPHPQRLKGTEAVWQNYHICALTLGDGTIGGVLHTVDKATEIQRLQQSLHASKERSLFLERALSHMGDYVYVWDRDKKFIYANERLEKLWAVPRGQYKGKTMADLGYASALAEQLTDQVEQVLTSGRSVAGVTPYTSPTGAEGHYEYLLNPLIDAGGDVQFVAGVSRDILERQRAGEALRKSEQRYRALFESIDEGFCVFEVLFDDAGEPIDYLWLETNPAFERHTGLLNAVGQTARELVPNLEPHWPKTYGRVALTGEPHRFVEQSSAMGRWFEVDAFRVGDPEERKVALLFSDVTERKETEQALKDADQRKDEFLATLAHELRNPLAAIRAGIEVVKMAQDNPSILLETYHTMERQTQQLVSLVDDLLEVSRVTQGKLELRKSRVKLTDVVTSAVESSQSLFAKTHHTLVVDLPSQPIVLEADPNRLAQVLSNLLNNAAKYTPEGGRVVLSAALQADEVIMSVQDSGIGIPADRLNHIFTMFAQIGGLQEGEHKGLGVGLALAKSLVEMHGGQIEAESRGIGQGATFTVRLPASEAPEETIETPTAQHEESATMAHRVLVVDDNTDAANMLSMVLSMLGNEVATAHSGREAVDMAADFLPEIILMDLGMPTMDGFEAVRRIRKEPWGKATLIVALSGWGQEEDRRKTREAGFDHHLVKPTEISELQQVLSRLEKPIATQ